MKDFKKKALIHDREEWEEVYRKSLGVEGFPCSYWGSFPVLVLQAESSEFIFLEASDIRELLGLELDDGR